MHNSRENEATYLLQAEMLPGTLSPVSKHTLSPLNWHALASEQGTHQTVTWTDARVSAGRNKASPRFHLPKGVGNNYLAPPPPAPLSECICAATGRTGLLRPPGTPLAVCTAQPKAAPEGPRDVPTTSDAARQMAGAVGLQVTLLGAEAAQRWVSSQ